MSVLKMFFLLVFGINLLFAFVDGGFFCAQFRPYYRATVSESAPAGTVIGTTLPSKNKKSYMNITDGDLIYIHYDNVTGNITTKTPLSQFRGKTLQIKGNCREHIADLKYTLNIDGAITVDVEDLNDPPVFRNLPRTISIGESTPAGDVIYVVEASNPTDIDPFYDMTIYNIRNVTGTDRTEALDAMFMIDPLGRVMVIANLDYEDGQREFYITIQVKDAGTPSLSTLSHLHVYVNDSDDQNPQFKDKFYTASVIGEKPVLVEECHPTFPPLYAEDQDPVLKSPVRYHIKEGIPVEPWHWQNFFFLEAETGHLCQRETIPRIVQKRGDQTVRELFEGFHNYTLTVESYQTDDRSKSDTATLHVHVVDQNIHRPTFTRRRYKTAVDEYPAVRAGTVITTLFAEDEDYGKNSLFEFEMLDNPSRAFWIDSNSGEVKVNRPLSIDREKNETIIFKVRAKETSTSEKLFSTPDAIVEVTVLDDNDNQPKFGKSSYRFKVKDSSTVGTAIHRYGERLTATDPDLGENGTVHFSILSVTTKGGSFSMKDQQRFKIDKDSGVIKLADSLRDLRRMRKFPEFIITVKAEDQAVNPRNRLSSVVRVLVKIVEANDFPPFFENPMPVAHVSEAAKTGSLITKLKARDEDGDEDIYLKFRIVSGNELRHFRVSDKGYLSTNRPLDREKLAKYTLKVMASDGIHSAEATLTLHVRDTNDHAPVFNQSTYDFSLSEDAPANKMVGVVGVTDEDEGPNGKLIFSLVGEHAGLFGIRKSGEIYLKRRDDVIDREKTERVTLQIKAEDLGQPPEQGEATVRISLLDVNDNRPVFTKTHYTVGIVEETPGRNRRNKRVQMEEGILAEDEDKDSENRNILYSLRGEGADVFKIDGKSGRLFVTETRLLDCEKTCNYKLKVIAKDKGGKGLEGSADLSINIQDINDNKPVLVKNYTFTTTSHVKVGSVIGDIDATDSDRDERNRRLMYILRDGGYGKFRVDFDTGRVIVVDSLTREPQMGEYNLTVEVMDTGVPRLSSKWIVRVKVPINSRPVLEADQKVVVREDVRSGVKIGRVKVTDRGDVLTYKLTDNVPFRVSSDGTIRTTRQLDREESEGYTLKVIVTDRGYPVNTVTATIAVVVEDVNDNAPKFPFRRYSGEITEDDNRPMKGQVMHMSGEIIATDADGTEENRGVALSLKGEGSDKFTIDSDSGIVRVKRPGTIDCERKCSYNLKLQAQDQHGKGLKGEADLTILVKDVNDNAPVFPLNMTFTLDSMTQPGTFVGSGGATDKDRKAPNNVVLYVLTEGGDGKFEVDPYTGSIQLVQSLLQEPRREKYFLHLKAFDFGNPSKSGNTTITVHVPLNFPPEVDQDTHLSVRENASLDTDVGQIVARDRNVERGEDDRLTYYINDDTLADAAFPFHIDGNSGIISTKAGLDKETVDSYKFLVYVTDSLLPVYTSSTSVLISVQDENDSPPEFSSTKYSVTVLEDIHSTGRLQKLEISPSVSVTDKDTPQNAIDYSIRGNGSELFDIDPATGAIHLRPNTALDSETQQYYNLTIIASDGTFSSVVPLTVKVEDVNDHAPVFQGEITVNVSSLTSPGTVIGQVHATDSDVSDRNSAIMYFVTKGGLDKFAVHPQTGDIQVSASLLEEPFEDVYRLTVRAMDFGVPQMFSDTSITVYVPINYQPQLSPVTELHVQEDLKPGSVVGSISVRDQNVEKGDGDSLNFYIDEDLPFEIDRHTGTLSIRSGLDRETIDKYSFLVRVTDNKPPVYTSSTTVVITVKDVNDNIPVFTSSSYKASIKEDDIKPGQAQVVYLRPNLEVTDVDSTSDTLVYRLDGVGKDLFTIDPNTGRIQQRKAGNMDADDKSMFNLTLTVSDGEHETHVPVSISVEDVNDHVPVVTGERTLHVDPLTLPGEVVGVMQAEDGDQSERNRGLSYYLMSGSMDRFSVDEQTGEISVSDSLTEGILKDEYKLKVRVVDHGYPQQSTDVTLTIDVPVNFPPRMKDDHKFVILENAPMGTVAGVVVATDRNFDKGENERLMFFIDDTESTSLPFTLERDTGRVLTTSDIDRETQSEYAFSVFVTDSRSPVYTASSTVTVAVQDVNDNPPVFSSRLYKVSFPEDRDLTKDRKLVLIPKLSITDPDGDQIDHRLEGQGSELFTIESITGDVTIKEGAIFDTENAASYNLTIVASDALHSTSASLVVVVEDVNDNAPIFNKNFTVHLDPFVKPHTQVADASASDADVDERNNEVRYYLMGGGLDKFQINEETGQIMLVSSLMDDPKRSDYNLRVRAFDMGTPQKKTEGIVKLQVPVNYRPEFESSYSFTVKENITVGTEFGQVKAIDKNNERGEDDKLSYFIDEHSTQGVDFPFFMERDSGRLIVSCVLDREKEDDYNFYVFVIDSKEPVYTSSTIVSVIIDDVNDNPPQFTAASYTGRIQEDDSNPKSPKTLSIVPVVSATDSDSNGDPLIFTLIGPGSELFTIDPVTADVRQKKAGSLDSDTHQYFNLTLEVSDGQHETSSKLVITVDDTNDNAPRFTAPVDVDVDPEEKKGTVIGRVRAVDKDASPGNGDVAYYLQSGGLDKFSVDSNSGNVILMGSLLEPPYRDVYELHVRAVDFGQPQLFDTTVVTVRVPLNQAPIVSTGTVIRVDEDRSVGTEIGRIQVVDPDSNGTSHIKYLMPDPHVPFKIDQTRASIVLNSKLDSEKRDVYRFPVLVVDEGTPSHTVTTTIIVHVDGVNDEKPVFSHTMYTAMVEENLSLEDSLKPIRITPELSVSDGDSDGGEVVLTLEGEGSEVFTIDSVTYELKVKDSTLIDCEKTCLYSLRIIATDEDGHGLQSSANLTITVIDINDNVPTFTHTFNFTVAPDADVGTLVGVVEAFDADGESGNNRVTYLLTQGGAGKFYVDPTSGELLVADSLLRPPLLDIYYLNIQARDSGFPSLYDNTEVIVDVPINKPPTVPNSITLTVDESTPIWGYVGDVPVTDPDATAEYPVVYSLMDSDTFTIHTTTGRITTIRPLDSERQSQYITTVQIEDPGVPTYIMTSTLTINVADINDNYPLFSSPSGYSAEIKENDVNLTTAFLELTPIFGVTDKDINNGDFVFQLSGPSSEHFTIERNSGKITVAPDVDIDCEHICHYDLHIKVTDRNGHGLTSTAPLKISVEDINDNPPDVTSDLVYHVSPNASIGYVVGKVVAVDLDNSTQNRQLTYMLTGGGFGKFAVGFDNGVITVADKLSREPTLDEYLLPFIVRDSGFPSLSSKAYYTVKVPINQAPIFKPSNIDVVIPEDVEIGYVLADISVDDPDSANGELNDVTYDLYGHQGLFSIDKSTGLITTTTKLDAEHSATVDMTARAIDRGIPDYTGTTAIHVDITGVNDNIPTFSSSVGYTASIREDVGLASNLPVELVLAPGLTVADGDGDDVVMYLFGEGADMFAIDKTTNIITLEEPEKIDCEKNCLYNLSIIATDSGTPSTTSSAELIVQIEDVNEHAPEFAKTYVFPVPVEASVGTLVGYVEAVDKDFGDRNSDISYDLISGGYDKFAVHSNSGAITIADSLIREPQLKQYSLQVEARDQGYPQMSSETTVLVNVPVNEEPVLPQTMVYNVSEDFAVGDIIATVRAEDSDIVNKHGQFLEYSVIGGGGVFSIDRRTGDLILFDDLDAETKNLYDLKVKVEDHGYPSLTSTETVVINVHDVNDHPPVFGSTKGYIATIPESADVTITPIVEIVPELSVLDDDVDGSRDHVRFSLEGVGSESFFLDPVTGQLRVRNNATLDADLQQLYNLIIAARDENGSGRRAEATLDITIGDINDNPPMFKETYESIQSPRIVEPTTPIGTVVYTLVAEDADADEDNSRITYLLQSGGYGKFSVDAFSGEVKVADDLTREPLEKNYYLSVKALNSGHPQLSAETTVHLFVPLNTRPEPQTDIHLQVPENITVGDVVGLVYLKDFDGQPDGFEFILNTHVSDFTIDPQRGEIRTVKDLDAEIRSEYELAITIIDHGHPTHTVSTTATVSVIDIDDNLPQFSALTDYTATLQEGTYKGLQEVALFPGLSVRDDDITAGNSEYKMYLKGRGSQLFEITPDGSHLMLKDSSVIDAEEDPYFDLEIVAENMNDYSRRSSHNLTISIEDRNDHAPTLPKGLTFTVDPSSRVGTIIGKVLAADKDLKSPNNQVMYVMRKDGHGKFDVDIDEGDIFVKNDLTLEPTLDLYELQIEAIDKGFPALTGSTTVTVNVPINKPLRVPESVMFKVAEDVDVGTEVGKVVVDHSGTSGIVEYTLKDTDAPFTIDTSSGVVRTRALLDADTRAVYSLEVKVANIGVPSYTSTTTVKVNVGNINDNPPQFTSQRGYRASVVENFDVTLLDVVPTISVIDIDSGDVVTDVRFSLEGNGSELFTINPLSAAISVKDQHGLDAEQGLVYNLTILAADDDGKGFKTPANLKVNVQDVNDNAPVFEYIHSVKVDPRSPVGHKVVTVKARDADGSPENNRLLYFLRDGMGKFRINPLSGTIYLSSRLTEEPLRNKFDLAVKVVDSGFPPKSANTTVQVTVELNQPPVYDLAQTFHVQENQPSGTRVGYIDATDPDKRALQFTRLDFSVPLTVDLNTGVIRTMVMLDREKTTYFNLPVQIVDEGSPSYTGTTVATVYILDVNDNSPTFNVRDGYHGIIPEVYDSLDPYMIYLNQPIIVDDADSDADLNNIQLVLSGQGSDLFEIDTVSGHLILTAPEMIDSEQQPVFNLTVIAVDDTNGKGLTSSIPLYIDVDDFNDNPPEFVGEFEFDVATNAPVGAEIGRVVATDKDVSNRNNKVTYILKSGGYGKFQLDSETGTLSLSDNILREPVLGTYHLKVQALDSGQERLSGDTQVTIKVPVNSPPSVQDSFTFDVDENMPAGSVVGEITVDDPDLDSNPYETLEYTVIDRKAPFTFRSNSGVLTTTRSLDREREEYFLVPIQVVNPGAPAFTVSTTATVSVADLNDNVPVFSSSSGYVATMMENTITDVLNMSHPISVTDADSTEVNRLVTLHLSGDGSDKFHIDKNSGRVKIRTPGKVDAESQSSYNLTIVAKDKSGKGKQSTASLTITIEDLNDNSPVFPGRYNLSIAAGLNVGAVVGNVQATDKDVHRKNNRVTYLLRGGAFGKFDIDPDSGAIVVLEKLTVEPFRHVYHLSVEAIDSGEQRLSAETITTISVNLNKPPVVPKTAQYQVKENQTAGSVVGRLNVTDPDMVYNTDEELEFFTGEPKAPFTVERSTGIIRMATELDREKNDHFEMPVVVVNKGSPSYTSTSYVTIGIVDINDNFPAFSARDYVGRVVEDQPSIPIATQVQLERLILVTDNDITEDNRGIVVNLTGPGSDQFTLDVDTGHLYIKRPGLIDCEVKCRYNLKLYATDQNGRGLTSTANLTVLVEDVNDHTPEFEDDYDFGVKSGSPIGSQIGMVVATDRDRTIKNNRLTYLLIDGGHGKFDVDPTTGELFISDTLKREPYRDVFHLLVQAVDNGFPRRSSETSVEVHVPMNKAPHVDKVMSLTVEENLPVGSMVGKIRVTDPDSAINIQEPLEYYIKDTSVPFEVDRYTGELKLMSSVDREELDSVSFNVQVVNDGAPAYTMSTLVTVVVNDTNDHAPAFTIKGGYSGSVSENVTTHGGDVYVKLNHPIIVEDKDDTDENRNVRVKLSGPSSDNFIFEQDTGKIRIRDPSLVDAERQKTFELKLTATDRGGKGLSTSTNLSIIVDDVNDNMPVFVGNTTFIIDSALDADSSVGVIQVTDADATKQNNRITYLLTGGGHGKFTVDSNTGEIKVSDSLLREPVLDQYKLKVRVQDNGVPQRSSEAVVSVIVPVNHPPKLSRDSYVFNLAENNAIGDVVGTVMATDPDIPTDPNHRLTYFVDDPSGTFNINPDTGEIRAIAVIDREVTSEVVFDVHVKDNVYPEYRDTAKVRVIIDDLNDNPPILTAGSEYHGAVYEDDTKPAREQIVKLDKNITIIDRDATAVHRNNYIVLEGYASKFFRYDPNTGLVVVRTPGTIDREFNEVLEMQIVARDRLVSGLYTSATLRIDVADVNDNYPEFLESTFTFTLPSVVHTGDVAGKVVARDIDATEPNNNMIYLLLDNPLGKFSLDVNSGDLILLQSFFSKPRKDVYTVTVEARDMGYPSRKAQTQVIIRAPYFDFNDHPPDFKGETMFVTREEIPLGAVVGRLNVVDEDRGLGTSGVTLEMMPSSNKVPFKVEADGSITCTARIDRDLGPNYYTFKVRATDKGSPPFNVTRDISVIVDDVNDNPPKFSLRKYKHMVSESFPPRTVIATPFAFDNVDEKDSVYRYSMTGDQQGYFHINAKTGVVITTDMASTLDPQTMKYQIEAVDLYNQKLKARTELEIQVIESVKPTNITCK